MATRVAEAKSARAKKQQIKGDGHVASAAPPAGLLKLKTLVEQVTEATGGKKKAVRETVEATLSALAQALAEGQDFNLPPLGKAKVSRRIDSPKGGVLVLRLRLGGGSGEDEKDMSQGVAEPGE